MSDAPERIWATEDAANHGEDRFHSTKPMRGLTEYIRADLHQAALDRAEADKAAAVDAMREAAERAARDVADQNEDAGWEDMAAGAMEVLDAIRAIPTPAPMTVAQAARVPEVAAQIAAASLAWQGLVGEYGYQKARVNFGPLEDALDALAPLTEAKP